MSQLRPGDGNRLHSMGAFIGTHLGSQAPPSGACLLERWSRDPPPLCGFRYLPRIPCAPVQTLQKGPDGLWFGISYAEVKYAAANWLRRFPQVIAPTITFFDNLQSLGHLTGALLLGFIRNTEKPLISFEISGFMVRVSRFELEAS